jgi:ADP-ribosyl-[dinitrogen reductase] hydrolase
MSKQSKIESVGKNLLPAIGYGDSAGLPVEFKKRQAIIDGFGWVNSLLPINNKFFGEAPAGTWSDDTQLSLAVAESLVEAKGFSMESLVEHHVKAMTETPQRTYKDTPLPRGWGKSTWESVLRLKDNPNSWKSSGNPTGEGNGVLMKLAPLALWQTLRPSNSDNEQIEQLATMTHANDLSVVTALVHRDILAGLFNGNLQPDDVAAQAASLADYYEIEYKKAGHKTSTLLGRLALLKEPSPEDILEIATGGGFQSSETLVMAYGAFSKQRRFPAVIFEAVNLGGDSDSVGSIVGAMAVMHSGTIEKPHDLLMLDSLDRLRLVGQNLVKTAIAA